MINSTYRSILALEACHLDDYLVSFFARYNCACTNLNGVQSLSKGFFRIRDAYISIIGNFVAKSKLTIVTVDPLKPYHCQWQQLLNERLVISIPHKIYFHQLFKHSTIPRMSCTAKTNLGYDLAGTIKFISLSL
jgi:hypothetical protein